MNDYLHRLLSRKRSIPPMHVVWLLIIFFVCYFTFLAFSRHDNFYSLRIDLGNMDQTVWNVLHGYGFTMTDPFGTAQESRLAVHADFLLILLAPLYLLWSDPRMLILIQTVIIALGALPVYWIAVERLKSERKGALFAVMYLLYPPVERMTLHDFHAVALSMSFLLFAYWYLLKDKPFKFFLFGALAGLGKEQIWLTTGMMSLYMAVRYKRYLFGIATGVGFFALFYYLLWVAIPAAAPSGQHFALAYLSEFGDQQNIILKNIMLHPMTVLVDSVASDRLYYYFQLLSPIAFLPMLAPFYLIFAAPSLVINVLSNNTLMRIIDYQYTSDITPFVFIAAIEGYVVVTKLVGHSRKIFWLTACFAVVSSVAWGELPYGIHSRLYYFTTPQPEQQLMQGVVSQIGPMYTVSATNNIGSHVSQRQYLYSFPVNALTADYSLAVLGDQYAWPSGQAQEEAVNKLLVSPDYMLIAHQNQFFAFKRKGL